MLGDDLAARLPSINALSPEAGYFDVVVHGARAFERKVNGVWQKIPFPEVRQAMYDAGYKDGQPVRLVACNSGKGGLKSLAARFSRTALGGAEVKAPDKFIWVFANGRHAISGGMPRPAVVNAAGGILAPAGRSPKPMPSGVWVRHGGGQP